MMRRISLSLLAATAMGVIASQGASAADMRMPVKAPAPLPPPVQDWSGVYVGVEGGYGWGHENVNNSVPFALTPGDTDCFDSKGNICHFSGAAGDNGLTGPFAFPNTHGLLQNFTELGPLALSSSGGNQSGGVVGGFFGVQKQWGSWVLGLEGSVDYANITSSSQPGFLSSTVSHTFATPPNEGTFTQATNAVNFNSRIDTIGAVNAKVGWAWSPNWMVYGTGGMAFAHERNNISISQSLFHMECDTTDATGGVLACDARTGAFGPPGAFDGADDGLTRFASTAFGGSGGTSLFGWTAGAGIDYKWQLDAGSAIIFGIDYKHYGFGTHTFTVADNNGGSFSFSSSQDIDVVKGRISYLFSIH
jgi:outer membrane immunogenic protein